jgi:hypothetical protein
MSFSSLLIHECDLIQKNVVVGQDEYGRDIYGESVIPGIRCRADQLRTSSSRDEYGVDFIVENVVFFGPDVQIIEDMTVNNIKDLRGNLVLDGSFIIKDIFTVYGRVFLHHYEVTLQRTDG